MRKHVFLLSGLTRCEECGNPHTHSVVAKKGKSYYHCNSRANCDQPYIPKEALESQVAAVVAGIRLSDEFVSRVAEKVGKFFAEETGAEKARRSTLLRRQELLAQQRAAAEEKLLSGVLTDDAYKRNIPRITGELAGIQEELAEMDSRRQLNPAELKRYLLGIGQLPARYAAAPPQVKKDYLAFFFKEFLVRDKVIVKAVPTEVFHSLMHGSTRDGLSPRVGFEPTT